MDPMEAESLLRKLDRRLQNVEQILPSLATRDDLATVVTHEQLDAVVATLATKADLASAIAPLATKAEMREEGERTRRHMDVVAESLRDDIRLIAESHLALEAKVDRHKRDADAGLKNHAERITRLEALTARERRQKRR